MKYDKLVRDKIPQIIEASNKTCKTEVVSGDIKYKYLENKLKEEVNEFIEDKNLEELADIMEVLYALAEHIGYKEEELINKRKEKFNERGGFSKGIILKEAR